jgi:hypothetical protein
MSDWLRHFPPLTDLEATVRVALHTGPPPSPTSAGPAGKGELTWNSVRGGVVTCMAFGGQHLTHSDADDAWTPVEGDHCERCGWSWEHDTPTRAVLDTSPPV